MSEDTKKSLGAQVYTNHYDLVYEAARKRGLTVAQYVREVVLAWAASDLGAPSPDLSGYASSDLIVSAAREEGITAREFMLRAARKEALSRKESAISGTRPAIRFPRRDEVVEEVSAAAQARDRRRR